MNGHEDEFETYLRERSVLPTRLSGSQRIEPPRDLDAIVLGKARQAIRAPEPQPLYRSPRWALPVALAATILLSFSIVLNFGLTLRPHGQPSAQFQAAAQTPAAARSESSTVSPTTALAAEPSATAAAKIAAPTTQSRARAAEAGPVRPKAGGAAAASGESDGAAASRDSIAQLAGAEARPKTEPQAKPARDPAAWWRHIEALRAQGKTAEADAELRRFRAAFPDYPLAPNPPAARDPAK